MKLQIEGLKSIIKDMGLNPDDVTPEATLYDDVGLDSTEAIDFFQNINKNYGVVVPNTEFKKLTKITISELLNYISSKSISVGV